MSKTFARRAAPSRPTFRRTSCNLAVLLLLGAMVDGAVLAAPPAVGVVPPTLIPGVSSVVLPANAIPVLRGLVSADYKNGKKIDTVPGATITYGAATVAGQQLTIEQQVSKLILNWDQFNIGSGSKVEFIQPSATAAVLNRIFSADPSRIQGQLKANGQVLLINQNGILFDRGTQVDVNTLIASTLNIDDKRFQTGTVGSELFEPAFTGGYDASGKTVSSTKNGGITVGAGGAIGAALPRIDAIGGGSIVLIAPNIDNQSGVITAPDGQVILAAGRSVYLAFSAVGNAGFRGVLVEVTAGAEPIDLSSMVRNAGTITADRGNVTLAGLAINQSGRISASSATLTNGSIYLQARELNDTRRGTVDLKSGSVLETPLDTSDTTTLRNVDRYEPYRSVVKIEGARIVDEGRISTPGGNVSIDAKDPVKPADARIYLGAGSVIDASGAWSDASDASNLLTFKVTSNELKNSPDQKDSLLRGATVTVDLRASGNNLLDLSGYQDNQARTLLQKAAQGGSVTLSSSGDVIQRADSLIDVSGGGVRYTGSTEATTKLIGADGKVYDIGSAPEALRYTAIGDRFTKTEARWGYSQTFTNLLSGASTQRPDYVQGAAAGNVDVRIGRDAPGLVLDGSLRGGVTTGSQQRADAPRGGTLAVGFFDPTRTKPDVGIEDVVFRSGVLSSLPAGFAADSSLNAENKSLLNLSTEVFAQGAVAGPEIYATTGFSNVTVNANGRISVPSGVALQGPIGGRLLLRANEIEVDGRISAPGGTVTATAGQSKGSASSLLDASAVAVGRGGSIDTGGTWTNNALTRVVSAIPTAVQTAAGTATAANGGGVTLSAPVVRLQEGSAIDVSAGGSVSTAGAATGGSAGSIAITADSTIDAHPLVLVGTLSGYGFGTGGSLGLTTGSSARIGDGADAAAGLNLSADMFTMGGFQNYSVTATRDLVVATGTEVRPRQSNWQIVNAQAAALPTGADAAGAARLVTLPDDVRKPTSLSLGSTAGPLVMQTASSIATDAGASVKLAGATGVAIDGDVSAPAGSIAISLSAADQKTPTPVLELGSHGSLSARGAFVAKPNDRQLVQGTLLAGGTVSLSAQKAEIQLRAGSVIDVSGERQEVDLPSPAGAQTPYRRDIQFSNAGSVSITANDVVALGGTLRGQAGNNAAGGSFALTLTERGDFADPASGRRIVVGPSGQTVAGSASFKDVVVSADKLSGGGFDKLRLTAEDQIVFAADTTLRFDRGLTLDSKLIQVANDADVALRGANVKLANSFGERVYASVGDPSDPRSSRDDTLPSLPKPTAAGAGSLAVAADTLDLFGSVAIGGTARESLTAEHDLRLSGRTVGGASTVAGAKLIGSLVTSGDLTLEAAQIYPTTASTFTIAVADGLTGAPVKDGRIEIKSSAGSRGAVYSAGGSLTLAADHIVQGGVVEAPLGNLTLQAGKSLTLAPGSVTSVSANGLTIPYGETQAGVTWTYAATGSNPETTALTTPPAKRVSMTSPAIDVQAGATVDVSGGGDLAAVEFIPGSGGTNDALLQPNTFAILPAAKLTSAPIDPDLALLKDLGFGKDSAVYNSVRIGAGGPVPAGDYVLLPGYYGLLPGGYVVTLVPGATYANLQSGQTATLANGLTVVPGVMSAVGTNLAASNTIGVIVRPNTDIAKLADYSVTNSTFFAELADKARAVEPRLPTDGGQLVIAASQRLSLQGTLVAGLPTDASRSAEVDIAASKIALVDSVGRTDIASDYLQIEASSLSRLDASLLVGGVRSAGATGPVITPTATNIIVANSASTALRAPELLLAATDTIQARSGSRVESGGTRAVRAEDLTIGGSDPASGALVRVSNSGPVDIHRSATGAAKSGTVRIEAGATLASTGSLTLDATVTTTSKGDLSVAKGGALALSSGTVSLGETAGLANADQGLVLDNQQLAGFNALDTFTIKSYQGMNFYGRAEIGSAELKNLTLDSASLSGRASATGAVASTQVIAGNVNLINSTTSSVAPAPTSGDAGSFGVAATHLTIGAGNKVIDGYSGVQLNASGELLAVGTGTLRSSSDLDLRAARIGSQSGANQAWTALDISAGAGPVYRAVTIDTVAAPSPLADSTALGSRLTVAGSSIADAGTIVMKAGSVSLQALGASTTDVVQLLNGAVIDAGGASKDFKGTVAVADAGQVALGSLNAGVVMATGATIKLDGAIEGGNAGSLSVNAKSVSLAGTLSAVAKTGTQGNVAIDVAALDAFSTLNAKLNDAGFTESRDLRVRSGDITVAAADVVKARQLVIASDAGSIDVNGRIDASATRGGGSVELYGTSVRVNAGAIIDASATPLQPAAAATAPAANGGVVALVAQGGALNFANGAVIDVRAGDKGNAGTVLMRAPRTANSVAATLAGQVLSQRQAGDAAAAVVVEGNRVYGPAETGSTVTGAMIGGYAADNTAYVASLNAAAVTSGIRGDNGAAQGNVHVRPAVELRAAGDLTIADNWDLTGSGWLTRAPGATTSEAGSLVVRAAGNLTLASVSVGNPDNFLPPTATWSIGLTSGADLSAANPTKTRSTAELTAQAASGRAGAGDLVLDSAVAEASIRTGTGQVRLAAGRDFAIRAGVDAETELPIVGVVYTAGRAAIEDPLTGPEDNRFAKNGGSVAITAQRNATGAGNEWVTEWFRGATAEDGGLETGAWWSYRPNFHDGVAALGGGNVAIQAGGDIRNLSAWTPTSSIRVGQGANATLQVFGGGDLDVRAGNDIVGGRYLVSRGAGRVTAAGNVGTTGNGVQLFMMGASDDAASAQARVTVQAGQSLDVRSIDNPTTLALSQGLSEGVPGFNASAPVRVLSYSANSKVELTALGGDIRLGNRPEASPTVDPATQAQINASLRNADSAAILPATVALTAFDGGIVSTATAGGAILFPSMSGSVKLLAGKGIAGTNLTVSDANPDQFSFQNVPDAGNRIDSAKLRTTAASPNRIVSNTSTDTFINDVVALDGSVTDATLRFPTRSRVWAADDIRNPTLSLQNLQAGDETQLIADRGSFSGPTRTWGIGGPGALLVQAGRDVSLGTVPFSSYGSQVNTSLPSSLTDPSDPTKTIPAGASITVVAGVSGVVDIAKLDAAFDKLVRAGSDKDANAARAVIDTLFASSKIGSGNIESYNTSIQTNVGSPINLLAPGGNITVGLTTENTQKLIGVVTNGGGAIRSYLGGNFDINRGKVLTAQGGDILIYTASGSIDAGRGAKTSVTTPPPTRTPIVENGVLVGYSYTLPVAVAGSGIQTATSKPGGPSSVAPPAGNIYLFAPSGVIDAGEAGIASGGNIFIAALTVLNADNISSAGTAVGVPPVVVGSIASSVAASGATTAASATKDGDAAKSAAAAAQAASAGSFKPAILTVEVLGFGDKNCKEQDKDCFAK